jgi:hypothetical protein
MHWRGVESRCGVPFTSFSENKVLADGSPSMGLPSSAWPTRRGLPPGFTIIVKIHGADTSPEAPP